jgi:ribosomal protein S17E
MEEETKQTQETSQEKAVDVVEEARKERTLLEAQIAENKKILERMEAIKTREILGGQTGAGYITPKLDPEQQEKQRINDWLKPFGRSI